jgi:hypothetical protein
MRVRASEGDENGWLVELASGIDALYLSGKVPLSTADLEELERHREDALEAQEPIAVRLGGEEFGLKPGPLNRYRFRLTHQYGEIGITTSEHMPQLRIQPRAQLLHGLGPTMALEWFTSRCEEAFGAVQWSANRMDVFCDVQGWEVEGNDRDRFKCKANQRILHENGTQFTGFQFGKRSTGTVSARIYDKTVQIEATGTDYWFDIWGDEFNRDLPVFRIEFEVGRQGLGEFGIMSPEEAIGSAGGLWAALTEDWLSYRDRTGDMTGSRWPVAEEWRSIQGAQLRGGALGLDRIRARRGAGKVRRLVPPFVGYMARLAQHFDVTTLDEALGVARSIIREDEDRRDVLFEHRVEILRNQDRFG